AGVLAEHHDDTKFDQEDFREVVGEVLDVIVGHQQVGDDRHDEAAAPLGQHFPGAVLLPDDGHALDGPGDDDHREEGDGEHLVEPQLVAQHAESGHQDHHGDQHRAEARHHQEVELAQVGADPQSHRHHADDDDEPEHQADEDDDPGHQGGLNECQGDQHRHEGAGGLEADQHTEDHHHQGADGDQQQHLEDVLLVEGQAVDVEIHQGHGLALGFLQGHRLGGDVVAEHGEAHPGVVAADGVEQGLAAPLPHEEVVGNALGGGLGIEEYPLLAVVDLDDLLGA